MLLVGGIGPSTTIDNVKAKIQAIEGSRAIFRFAARSKVSSNPPINVVIIHESLKVAIVGLCLKP